MYGFMLQDWTMVRLAFDVPAITQGETDWSDLREYRDLVLWLEVRELSLASGITGVVFNYETSPTRDEPLFIAAATSSTLTGPLATAETKKVILAANPTVPLARWLRWKIATTGAGSSGNSTIVFRIAAAANAVGALG